MSKVLDSLNEKYGDKLYAEKIDLYEHREYNDEFKVRYVPHLLFVDAQGKVFQQEIGFMQEKDVLEIFAKNVPGF